MAGSGIRRDAVTGAFGFTGRAIAAQLLEADREVVTLARRVDVADPIASQLFVRPLDFTAPARLADALSGVDTLYNTYWIRFPRGGSTFEGAVEQSSALFAAAREAGVRRIVHVSVVRADPAGATPYVRAKGELEERLKASGLEWSIVRPTLTYGPSDILVNNLAWALRRPPLYGIPGRGRYPIQPVHVDDVARICLEAAEAPAGHTVDAAGPDTMPYREMVAIVRRAVRSHSLVVPLPMAAVLAAARVLGVLVRDVVLTRNELLELTSGLLTSEAPPLGRIAFAPWVTANADALGRRWSSELARNYRNAPPAP
ncbi:MAG: SDR family oxidoreductase [Candidatus Limnocylindrales bacterium]